MLWNYRARDLSFRNAHNPPRNLRCALLLICRRSDHLPNPRAYAISSVERWVAPREGMFRSPLCAFPDLSNLLDDPRSSVRIACKNMPRHGVRGQTKRVFAA